MGKIVIEEIISPDSIARKLRSYSIATGDSPVKDILKASKFLSDAFAETILRERSSLKVNENEFCFVVDGKTGEKNIMVPKKDSYEFKEIVRVHAAALEFAKITAELFDMCVTEEMEKEDNIGD